MKGKNIKFKIATAITMLLAFVCGFSVSILNNDNVVNKVAAASSLYEITDANSKKHQFSANFGGDVLFSVEKVLMNKSITNAEVVDDYYITEAKKHTFYQRTASDTYGEYRDFLNYNYATDDSKYVVGNGEFVKLDNVKEEAGTSYQYSSLSNTGYTEAIVVSFGAYMYDNGNIYDPNYGQGELDTTLEPDAYKNNARHSGVTQLNISGKHNEHTLSGLNKRDIIGKDKTNGTTINYYDFVYIIPQIEGNDGYYFFSFSYLKNGTPYTASFEFYILFDSSYSGKIETTNTYNINPTLGWNEQGKANFEKTASADDNGYVRYYIGKSGLNDASYVIAGDAITSDTISYPTITYDCSKFALQYEHVANNRTTKYVYNYVKGQNSVDSMRYYITTNLGQTTIEKPLTRTHESNNKIITIVLTEPGSYDFSFEYIYGGYTPGNQIVNMNLEGLKTNLHIHGFELLYSKFGYQSAEMKYLNISYNETESVDLIVPNGFDVDNLTTDDVPNDDGKILEDYKKTNLGFFYKRVNNSTIRVGDVINNNGTKLGDLAENHNPLINADLGAVDKQKLEEDIINNWDNTSLTATSLSSLDTILSNINYERTNQGYLSFKMNEAFEDEEANTKDSFYFFSSSKIIPEDLVTKVSASSSYYKLSKEDYNFETTFAENGFYLVFMKVYPKGLEDDPSNNKNYSYYQIYAFEYTTSTVNLDARESTGKSDRSLEKAVGSFGFTKHAVTVDWKEPGVFDRALSAYYYISQISSNDDTTIDSMLLTSPIPYVKGSEIENPYKNINSFARVLVEIRSEGKAATHHLFTIDNEPISGVSAYSVSSYAIAGSINDVYYAFTNGPDNGGIRINNGITDGYATLDWNYKGSGSKITVNWSYTQFVADSNNVPNSQIVGPDGKVYIKTAYKLGNTISGVDMEKSDSKSYVEENDVLKGQGIYVFNLVDQAGNSCKYMLVIDRTENYFKITDSSGVSNYVASATSHMFGDSIEYTVGDYKAIDLSETTGVTVSEEVKNFIEAITSGGNTKTKLEELGYYCGDVSNYSALVDLFRELPTGSNTNYLTVKNSAVYAYDGSGYQITTPQNGDNYGTSGKINKDKNKPNKVVSLYIKGKNSENTAGFNAKQARSRITIEINLDNAKGTVFYSSEPIESVPSSESQGGKGVYKLSYGAEPVDNRSDSDKVRAAIGEAHATSANYVGFVWNIGTGAYTVKEVTYSYYKLNTTNANYFDDGYYFYEPVNENVALFKDGVYTNGAGALSDGLRAFAKFGGENVTEPGLYVVTRSYAEQLSEGDTDRTIMKYYFIVDKNGIIQKEGSIGSEIEMVFLDNVPYNKFDKYGLNPGNLQGESSAGSDGSPVFEYGDGVKYYTYLTTSKVPVTLSIPTGKYTYSDGRRLYLSNGYHAGRIKFKLYFIDSEGQLNIKDDSDAIKSSATHKIYEGEITTQNQTIPDFYTINILEYLKDSGIGNYDRISKEFDDGKWLYLPGTYVVVLEDNVLNTSNGQGTNIQTFAFKVETGTNPTVEFTSGWEEDKLRTTEVEIVNKTNETFNITTNERYVWFELPATQNNITTYSQVDPNYLIVKKVTNYGTVDYINYQYNRHVGGSNLDTADFVDNQKDAGGNLVKRIIKLDTGLMDSNGNIITDNINEKLEYFVTIRYYLTESNQEQYKHFFSYYDGDNVIPYYESTYRIVIDRVAPKTNLNNLTSAENDNLIDLYDSKMFEEGYHKVGQQYYFTYQYKTYYTSEYPAISDLFVVRAYENTEFNSADTKKVLYKALNINNLEEFKINLPATTTQDYNEITEFTKNDGSAKTYGDIVQNSGYYEFIEMDKAGNQTQYIVYIKGEKTLNQDGSISIIEQEKIELTFNYTSLEGTEVVGESIIGAQFYDIAGNSVLYNGYFYVITLSRTGYSETIKTNLTYNFSNLAKDIANMITEASYGTYSLSIADRHKTITTDIIFADEANKPEYNKGNLVKEDERQINIYGGDNCPDKVWAYAKEIKISVGTSIVKYTGSLVDGQPFYIWDKTSASEELLKWNEGDNLTYKIVVEDNFGRPYTLTYNTAGNHPVVVEKNIQANGVDADCYQANNGTYYSFKDVVVKYDNTIFAKTGLKISKNGSLYTTPTFTGTDVYIGSDKIGTYSTEEGGIYHIITFNAPAPTEGEVTYKLQFIGEDDELVDEVEIAINTDVVDVTLIDAATNEDREMKIEKNVTSEDINTVVSNTIVPGNVNWNFDYKLYDYFTYTCTLRTLGETVTETELTEAVKITKGGKYQLVITIYSADKKYIIGNIVYAAEIADQDTGLYKVVGFNSPNSSFKYDSLKDEIKRHVSSISGIPGYNLPLYITNDKDIQIQYYDALIIEDGIKSVTYTYTVKDVVVYTFTLYKVSAASYSQFFGVLIVNKQLQLVENVNLTKTSAGVTTKKDYDTDEDLFNLSGAVDDEFKFKATAINQDDDYLLKKNKLVLEVYYNDVNMLNKPAIICEYENYQNLIEYTILGSGDYTFVIKDLAGNVHYINHAQCDLTGFETDEEKAEAIKLFERNDARKAYTAYVYREVVVLVNDASPIVNAYYNGTVKVGMYARARYIIGSISVYGTLNGENLSLENTSSYEFSAYGTYKITFVAMYDDGSETGVEVRKTISFTIINPKEARKSIDITNLSGYEIVSIQNQAGNDVTAVFNAILAENKDKAGMSISYEDLYNYSLKDNSALQLYAGKQAYTLTYVAKEKDYPVQQVSFTFMLNNATPKIDCSLEVGKTTTKGFTVWFNPAIIYEGVGEAYVYINDEVVMFIDENAPAVKTEIARTFKANGAGDYYIKIVSTSGTVLTSYKATIKEPLNVWAIIIIIVAVVVVGGVTTTIIVLRHKMRIR